MPRTHTATVAATEEFQQHSGKENEKRKKENEARKNMIVVSSDSDDDGDGDGDDGGDGVDDDHKAAIRRRPIDDTIIDPDATSTSPPPDANTTTNAASSSSSSSSPYPWNDAALALLTHMADSNATNRWTTTDLVRYLQHEESCQVNHISKTELAREAKIKFMELKAAIAMQPRLHSEAQSKRPTRVAMAAQHIPAQLVVWQNQRTKRPREDGATEPKKRRAKQEDSDSDDSTAGGRDAAWPPSAVTRLLELTSSRRHTSGPRQPHVDGYRWQDIGRLMGRRWRACRAKLRQVIQDDPKIIDTLKCMAKTNGAIRPLTPAPTKPKLRLDYVPSPLDRAAAASFIAIEDSLYGMLSAPHTRHCQHTCPGSQHHTQHWSHLDRAIRHNVSEEIHPHCRASGCHMYTYVHAMQHESGDPTTDIADRAESMRLITLTYLSRKRRKIGHTPVDASASTTPPPEAAAPPSPSSSSSSSDEESDAVPAPSSSAVAHWFDADLRQLVRLRHAGIPWSKVGELIQPARTTEECRRKYKELKSRNRLNTLLSTPEPYDDVDSDRSGVDLDDDTDDDAGSVDSLVDVAAPVSDPKGIPWTRASEFELVELVDRGLTWSEIGSTMRPRRTERSCHSKWRHLKATGTMPKRYPTNNDDREDGDEGGTLSSSNTKRIFDKICLPPAPFVDFSLPFPPLLSPDPLVSIGGYIPFDPFSSTPSPPLCCVCCTTVPGGRMASTNARIAALLHHTMHQPPSTRERAATVNQQCTSICTDDACRTINIGTLQVTRQVWNSDRFYQLLDRMSLRPHLSDLRSILRSRAKWLSLPDPPPPVASARSSSSWRPSEDELLRVGVVSTPLQWSIIAGIVGTRTPTDCQQRWREGQQIRGPTPDRRWEPASQAKQTNDTNDYSNNDEDDTKHNSFTLTSASSKARSAATDPLRSAEWYKSAWERTCHDLSALRRSHAATLAELDSLGVASRSSVSVGVVGVDAATLRVQLASTESTLATLADHHQSTLEELRTTKNERNGANLRIMRLENKIKQIETTANRNNMQPTTPMTNATPKKDDKKDEVKEATRTNKRR